MHLKRIYTILISALIYNGAFSQTVPITDEYMSKGQMRCIEFLCDTICNGRESSTKGSFECVAYIQGLFRSNSLKPLFSQGYIHQFEIDSARMGHNVAGILHGRSHRHYSKPYIIICAHFDHLGHINGKMYPGADANASGVALMKYVMERFHNNAMHGMLPGRSLIFIGFDGKEFSMSGSKAFVDTLVSKKGIIDPATGKRIGKEQIAFVLNIDQVGTILEPVDGHRNHLIILGHDKLEGYDKTTLDVTNKYFVPDLKIEYSYYGSRQFTDFFMKLSDQLSFNMAGIPALMLTSGITMHTYKTSDTPQTIDTQALLLRSKLVYLFTERVSR